MLITLGWATTLYHWRRKWLRQQQAWKWWHQQQAIQSHHTAESIRDGLLQQTFAFRRYLETIGEGKTTDSLATPNQTTRWLERFQTFYHSLETLSDELSPPFIADSLPLALQFTLKNWQSAQAPSQHSAPALSASQLHFPPNWPQSPPHQNQIILSIVTALLTHLPKGYSAQPPNITLSRENKLNALTLQISNVPDQPTSKILELAELQHLKEIFHSLAAGQLEIVSREASPLTIRLCWPNEIPDDTPNDTSSPINSH